MSKKKRIGVKKHFEPLTPPSSLSSGFLAFAKSVKKQADLKGAKLSEKEVTDLFNNSFPGKVRANFIFWVNDLNRSIEAINLITHDLRCLRFNRGSLQGDPIIRSEFLFLAFFSEFYLLRETGRHFLKYLYKEGLYSKKSKDQIFTSYGKVFQWVYEIRNQIVHERMSVKSHNVKLDEKLLDRFDENERKKFNKLLKESNSRESTIELQCAIYIEIITEIMKQYSPFQEGLNELLANLILEYETGLTLN